MQLRNIQAKALNKEWHHGIVSNSSTIKRERSGAKTKNFAVWPPEQANTEDLAHNNVSVLSPFSHVQLSATPWAVARQTPLSIGLSKQEYWSGEPSSPGELIDTGTKSVSLISPALAGRFLTTITISVQFSCSVMSDSLQPHEPQHTRPPCPSPTPRVRPNPCPLSRWCHPVISSSVIPFPSCPQSLPGSGSFPMSHFFASGG